MQLSFSSEYSLVEPLTSFTGHHPDVCYLHNHILIDFIYSFLYRKVCNYFKLHTFWFSHPEHPHDPIATLINNVATLGILALQNSQTAFSNTNQVPTW